jgi:hypothetical protein
VVHYKFTKFFMADVQAKKEPHKKQATSRVKLPVYTASHPRR